MEPGASVRPGRVSIRRTVPPSSRRRENLRDGFTEQVEAVRKIGGDLGVDLAAEDLGLGLWVANHADGLGELWGTSEQIWLDRKAIERRPIHADSRWVGVAAMVRGVPVEQDPAVYTTRWRFIRGIPLVVEAPDRSLVGSLTLTSATPLDECPLSIARAPREFLLAIDELLWEAAAGFFMRQNTPGKAAESRRLGPRSPRTRPGFYLDMAAGGSYTQMLWTALRTRAAYLPG